MHKLEKKLCPARLCYRRGVEEILGVLGERGLSCLVEHVSLDRDTEVEGPRTGVSKHDGSRCLL
ncbi:hypothetical protein Scep_027718 [Stephania cephalantha]|uniref:Uncharacterized protein n=1 Tax=Stephania cephalantha TaxID=152367 RepID=A0AAP0HLD3_9MAGN